MFRAYSLIPFLIPRPPLRRRNFTDEQKSYWRFRQHELEKKEPHRPEGKGCQNGTLKTAQRIAQQHHVSETTIHRDVKFGRAVDAIADAAGDDAKEAILRGDVKITRQETQSR